MLKTSDFCEQFYASHFLPVVYCEKGEPVCSAGLPEGTDQYRIFFPRIIKENRSASVFSQADGGYYGSVKNEKTGGFVLFGPAYGMPVDDKTVRAYMNLFAVPSEKREQTAGALGVIPNYTYNRFMNLVLFVYSVVNKKALSAEALLSIDADYVKGISEKHVQTTYAARDEQVYHGTYQFENLLLDMVKKGDPEALKSFLMQAVRQTPMTAGKLADTPLRQAKNIFIGLVTVVGKFAAIPAGLDTEQTYYLIDTYIQECERLHTAEQITALQFNMLVDFTSRISESRMPEDISPDVYAAMQYIFLHLNEAVRIDDIAQSIGRSRSWLTAKFRAETGLSVTDFVLQSKMQEAKTLLKYTDKPISEISEYLCFSSQPHFSTVFKKYFGVTPAAYRIIKSASGIKL